MEFSEKEELSSSSMTVTTVSQNSDLEWTEEEEKRLVRKVDILIIPLLTLAFFALQLDRSNIANALTDNFLRDVGITQNQFNIGQQLLSTGLVILEIPSNLILYKVGPTLWIGCQVITWGIVATFQAFQKGYGSYLATRVLLGLCEGGFIPAGLFTISRWYKRDEISKRFAWYFLGLSGSSALSGLISFGVLRMRGIAGLTGWQWLFILEGIFTILIGIAILVTLPNSISNPVSLMRFQFFNERESKVLLERVLRDDPSKAHGKTHVTRQELKKALTNWRILPHFFFTVAGLAVVQAVGTYAPTLVTSFGYDRLTSNALVSVGAWGSLFTELFCGWISDKLGVRGPIVVIGFLVGWIFNIANRSVVHSTNKHLRFGILATSMAVSWPWHPINGSWLSLNTSSPGERSVVMAIHVMAANCAGIVGGQLFRAEDAPLYVKGWNIVVGLSTAGLVLSILANVQYYFGNRRQLHRTGVKYRY